MALRDATDVGTRGVSAIQLPLSASPIGRGLVGSTARDRNERNERGAASAAVDRNRSTESRDSRHGFES